MPGCCPRSPTNGSAISWPRRCPDAAAASATFADSSPPWTPRCNTIAELADLPGRFLFGLDDGRGDISGLGADAGVHALDESTAALLLAGRDTGVRLAADRRGRRTAVGRRPIHRDARKESGVSPNSTIRLTLLGPLTPIAHPRHEMVCPHPPARRLDRAGPTDASRSAPRCRFGVLDAEMARYLAAVDAPMAVTPWRSVLLFDLDEDIADVALRVLAPRGLVFDEQLTVAVGVGLHRKPRLRALRRRCPRRRRSRRRRSGRVVGGAPPLRRLRAGLRQPCPRRGPGRDRRRLPAA